MASDRGRRRGEDANNKDKSDAVERALAAAGELTEQSVARVTEARLRTEAREERRRDNERRDDEKRGTLLRETREATAADDAAVSDGWDACRSATSLRQLVERLDRQKSLCDAALSRLDGVASALEAELRGMDHEYVLALKENRREMEEMQRLIDSEHAALKRAFDGELRLVQESLEAERQSVLREKRDELDALAARRNEAEIAGLERQHEQIERRRLEVAEREARNAQECEAVKDRLEAECRRLEAELAETQAKNAFDSDQLDFDVRVLSNRPDADDSIKKQKRRIVRGKEVLARERDRRQHAKSRGERQNALLELDCERIERQSSGLRDKFARFQVSDREKYRAVLAMHRDDLRRLQDELRESRDFVFGDEALAAGGDGEEGGEARIATDAGEEAEEIDLEAESDSCSNPYSSFRTDEWSQAESLLSDYRSVLQRRGDLEEEVVAKERQNSELERRLESNLAEKINEELKYPPSAAIELEV